MPKSLLFVFANILQLVMRFAQMIMVTRVLSSVELGLYYAAAAYPQVLSRLLDFGMPHACRYFILTQPHARRFIVRLTFLFSLAVAIPIFLVFLFMYHLPLESSQLVEKISENHFVLSLYCVLLIVNSILISVLISVERIKTFLVSSVIPYVVFIGVVAYKAQKSILEVDDVLLQLLISEAITLVIYSISISFMPKTGANNVAVIGLKGVVSYALKIYPTGMLKAITTRFDRVVLSFIAPPAFIGYYSVIMTLRDISIVPVSSYGQIFMNKMSSALRTTGIGAIRILNYNLLLITIIYLCGFLLFIPLEQHLMNFFFKGLNTDSFKGSLFLIFSTVPYALFSFMSFYFLVTNRPVQVSISTIVMLATFYPIIFVFHKSVGTETFFYASAFSTTCALFYLLAYYRSSSKIDISRNKAGTGRVTKRTGL